MEFLYRSIRIEIGRKELICLVGAGGKTSAMFRLAQELSDEGQSILVTTTTAIYHPEETQYDRIVITEKEAEGLLGKVKSGITVLGRSVTAEGKLLGVNPAFLDYLVSEGTFDFIIVEGDGSKGRPIKAPAGHEPVIPLSAARVLGVIGLDSVGKPVGSEFVHRPECFCETVNCREGDIINAEIVCRLIAHPSGLFKGAPVSAKKYVILNKADSDKEKHTAGEIVRGLSDIGCKLDGILVTSLRSVSKW